MHWAIGTFQEAWKHKERKEKCCPQSSAQAASRRTFTNIRSQLLKPLSASRNHQNSTLNHLARQSGAKADQLSTDFEPIRNRLGKRCRARDGEAKHIPQSRLISTLLVSAIFTLAVTRLQAQLPFQLPTSMVLETVSKSNLLQQYPDQSDLLNNITEIKKYLSADSPYAMRLSESTETAVSRQQIAQEMKQFGTADTNFHFHINFSTSQFIVEQLDCPPGSYPLNVWQPVGNKAKIRSDGFFDGTYFVMMPGGVLSKMEFDNLDTFKKACIDARRILGPPPTHNAVMEGACVDFEEFARFKNLGHEGIVPDSYIFTGNDFTCLGVRGGQISGSIRTNAFGLVDEISYNPSEHYGPRVFFLFYGKVFSNCTWYPSRIVDARRQGDKFAVVAINTVYNAYAEEAGALSIPNTSAELYGTNIGRRFEWSKGMAYEAVGTQLVARPTLVQRRSEVSPRTRNVFAFVLLTSSLLTLAAVVILAHKTKK